MRTKNIGQTPPVDDFETAIQAYRVADIVRIVGCPRGTAHHWRKGLRTPPPWLQALILATLKAHVPQPAPPKPRKPSSTTTPRKPKLKA